MEIGVVRPGQGAVDWKALGELRKAGYNGPISLHQEYKVPDMLGAHCVKISHFSGPLWSRREVWPRHLSLGCGWRDPGQETYPGKGLAQHPFYIAERPRPAPRPQSTFPGR